MKPNSTFPLLHYHAVRSVEAMPLFNLPELTTLCQQLGLSVKLGSHGKAFILGFHKGHVSLKKNGPPKSPFGVSMTISGASHFFGVIT